MTADPIRLLVDDDVVMGMSSHAAESPEIPVPDDGDVKTSP